MAGKQRIALITGASGGIGAELARVCAANGRALALVARDGDKMTALARELGPSGGRPPLVIPLDLVAPGAGETLAQALDAAGVAPDILINNAGYGLCGPACDLDRVDQLGVIDLNIRVLTDLTLRCLPDLIAARGRVLNVASVAAFFPGPGMAVYYASKAYVLSFSLAMAEELQAQGVSVTALCPGPVATGFGRRAGAYEGISNGMPCVEAAEVARVAYRAMMQRRRIATPGLVNRIVVALAPFAPQRLTSPLLARIQMRRTGRGA